jgi:hypothetical protein
MNTTDGCPNYQATRELVERVTAELALSPEIRLVAVSDGDAAERLHFLGSPTVRVDGNDIETGADAGDQFRFACRVYRTASGPGGQPDERWPRDALSRS